MKRVFVVQRPVSRVAGEWRAIFDISPAAAFGRFQFLLLRPGNIFLDALPTVVAHMRDVLRDFDDGDFLLPTGEPLAIAAAAMIAGFANGGRVKILKWNRRTNAYEPVQLEIRR